ncbi:arginyl-tRNA synthetase [Aeropyrum pernix K1]|uniref:Arginine--tRNA ligase n=1 Tax=Aeropyrum pernix (strain ATCC 700893 / DSM 11879 / JCM 9820 / NBRC 100138 / K1) TaxID=272557 RepID=SYR_AERPE|nr:arginine--tRNA ligase [Aeropyrum pernix]Q9YB39.1 RecName: Full=Arginine--tRNA ligase; AltName: Full=Arginyl-tRNA synthetase; Short=ArgRS [Aeropyrum pernix K1]BAA80759.1 arginyl-tRNA synthetase [Aeropyrum pernix K1]
MASSIDPLTRLHGILSSYLSEVLGVDRSVVERLLAPPPRKEYGDLGFPLMRFARSSNASADSIVESLRGKLWERGITWASPTLEAGYLNIVFDVEKLGDEVFRLLASGWRPSTARTSRPETIVVEHTSANPIHPLHLGHARNSSLGDALARLLEARGHRVNRRFYVDDVGRQAVVASLGFKLSGVTPRELASRMGVKVDHAVGWVYAVTHNALETVTARKRGDTSKVDEALSTLARLKERGDREVFDRILEAVGSLDDPEGLVSEMMRKYERGEEPEKSLIRGVVSAVLEGFRETLGRFGVDFDDWDWESDLLWSGLVNKIIEEARRSPFLTTHKDAIALDIPRIVREVLARDPEAASTIKLPRSLEIPPLILVRSDGTTLYTTRDLAYSVYKFRVTGADRVINVIGADQRLPQLQIRLALLGLGYRREALNMMHYDYEIVSLPGRRMSSRRGEYVTLDELLEMAKARSVREVESRNPGADRDWIESTAEKIAVGAVRFALVRPGRLKPITLDVERILDLKENTAPYLQYTYARASSILEKHGEIDYLKAHPASLEEGSRRELFVEALRFPLVSAKAADDLAPEDLASYLLRLADMFNSWYQKDSVIHEEWEGARHAKAALVLLVKSVIGEGLRLLGVEPLEKM